MTVGILTWAYTLLLPTFADAGLPRQPARGASTGCGRSTCSGSNCRRSFTA